VLDACHVMETMRREPTAVKVSAGIRRAALNSSNAVLAMVRIPTELTTRFNLHTRSKTLWLLLATPLVGNTGSVRHCSDYGR